MKHNTHPQKLAVIYPVGTNNGHFAYHVDYTECDNGLRIAAVNVVTSKDKAERLIRDEDPKLWGLIRTALENGEHTEFPNLGAQKKKGVAAR